ncbi:MAG: Hint domain-containing protein [Pseudomonadota bacterium]
MPYTIYALDEEFAVSTGDNVNDGVRGPGTSSFDYPPVSTQDLVIISQPGDTSPEVFSVGDTYTLSWSGKGSGADSLELTVTRSDPVALEDAEGHAVVFSGEYPDGTPVQLVWSPGIDLEEWYFDMAGEDSGPGFYNTDQNAQAEYSYVCFAVGTRIAALHGDVPVETLKQGDLVLTLDHGPQPLRWIGMRTVPGRYGMTPVEFAPHALDNDRPLRLSPQHRVLTGGWKAEVMFGSREVLVPARAFVGQPGVTEAPVDEVTYVHLLFDRHEIVLAEDIPCESLLLGQMSQNILRRPADDATAETGMMMPEILQMEEYFNMKAARPVLRMQEAVAFLDHVPPPKRVPDVFVI